jgi:predicted enzyme related to lactoylglutathione lyase
MNEMPQMNYVLVGTVELDQNGRPKEPGAINGGMMQRQDPLKSPVITISVRSIDESAVTIEKNGGKVIIPKMSVGDMGFSAYFQDTEGNVIGLWQNA